MEGSYSRGFAVLSNSIVVYFHDSFVCFCQMSMNAAQARPSVTGRPRASTPQALSAVYAGQVTQETVPSATVRQQCELFFNFMSMYINNRNNNT